MLERWVSKGGELAGQPFKEPAVEGAEIVHKGGGYFDVTVGEATERIQGKDQAIERAMEMVQEAENPSPAVDRKPVTLPGSQKRLLRRLAIFGSNQSTEPEKVPENESTGHESVHMESQPELPGTEGGDSDAQE